MCHQHKELHPDPAASQCAHFQRLSVPCLQVQDSYVAGKGVFARKDIPKGMRIGAYPGRPRSVPQILIKAETAPAAKGFVFHTSTGGPALLETCQLLLGQKGVGLLGTYTLALHCLASAETFKLLP